MKLDNKEETQKTINYLRALADSLELCDASLHECVIETRNVDWTHAEETLTIQYFRVNYND